MKLSQLKKIVTGGESDRVEFKASTGQRTIAAKTVCAMSNGLGGYLFFGVRNDGRIIGQKVADQTLRSITSELQKIEPPVFPEIKTVPTGTDTSVIVLIVQGGGGPFCFDGRPNMRLGPTTSIMPRIEYEHRIFERMHASQRWENQDVEEGITLNDLDRNTISSTFNSARQLGRIAADTEDIEAILRGHGLFHNGRLINAAVVLFGQHERLKVPYPQCSIRLARFRGVDRLGDFVDHRQIWGHAYHLLHQAQLFLQNHIPIAARVVPDEMERQDRPLYPPLAIREALANAICHRDYTNPGESVSVAMYNDRLEVISPGGLHFGLQPEDLVRPH
jgi:ATP-dependent DNA helicase RecG